MRDISDRIWSENQKTHFIFNNFFSENRAVFEIMWKIVVEVERPQMKILCMRVTFSIPKATFTHSEYAVLIAFP